MSIGDNIKRIRKERGMSQETLGAKLGVQKSAVSKWERGVVTKFDEIQLAEIARALNVSPAVLFGYSEDEIEMNALVKRVKSLPPDRVRQVMAFLDALEVVE